MATKAQTEEYNKYANELGLPTVAARIRPTKTQTVEDRIEELRKQVEALKPAPEAPEQVPAGIQKARVGTAIHTLIELVLDNPGFNRDQLCGLMEEHGFHWQSPSIAVNLVWQIPKKGYHVQKEGRGKQARYWITNTDKVI